MPFIYKPISCLPPGHLPPPPHPSRITPPILPPRPPPFLPPRTIKTLLPQLFINRIMRLAHPRAKLAPIADPWRVLRHPALEVLGAHPARVQLAERGEEGLGFGLELRGGLCGVCGGDGVEECPGGAPEGFDVGGAVGGEGGYGCGCGRCGGCFGGRLGLAAGHGEPGCDVGAGAASGAGVSYSAISSAHSLRTAATYLAAHSGGGTYGLPSGPRTTPFGSFLGATCSCSAFSAVST
jgi:hypothetical protein